MAEEILINVTWNEVRVALLEQGVLQEIYIERAPYQGLLGNIYKAKINRLLPELKAAFVDIGLEQKGFLKIPEESAKQFYVGQTLFVQVNKNPLGSKGPGLTSALTIPGRYLVLTPGVYEVAVSQKITDLSERKRLETLLSPGQYGGYIVRTRALDADEAALKRDQIYLDTVWSQIKTDTNTLVYQEIPLILRILRDLVTDTIASIRIDNEPMAFEMQAYAQHFFA